MRKKVLQELIENAKQDEKYIYQRYNGLITKYIDDGECYIGCNSEIAIKKNKHLMLGKVSENLIDLIEPGDIVNRQEVFEGKDGLAVECVYNYTTIEYLEDIEEIKEILTKELYEANCYKIGGE